MKSYWYPLIALFASAVIAVFQITTKVSKKAPLPGVTNIFVTNTPSWITGSQCIAIGVSANSMHQGAIVIGHDSTSAAPFQLVLRYVDGTEFRMILKTNIDLGW